MGSLEEDVIAATAMGLTYGKYKALHYDPAKQSPSRKKAPPKKKERKKRYTDAQVFELWQKGMTDAEIGSAVGVSRAMIQRWRSTMELPVLKSDPYLAKGYKLVQTEYGTYAVYEPTDDE